MGLKVKVSLPLKQTSPPMFNYLMKESKIELQNRRIKVF